MMEDDCANNVIPVPNVMASILSKMIEWCKKHAQMKEDNNNNNNEEKEKELSFDLVIPDGVELGLVIQDYCSTVSGPENAKEGEKVTQEVPSGLEEWPELRPA
ncbi:WSKP1 protein [Cinnamomum micranthum f. kanehirae]|uniref:WSKP1 protein n=1 Tax=Cinnamomum micranthum f. kanehirae TaxID=337451 RepID=A0A3S3NSW9_9MAGN|nr:WSKP1 protein [Cinnamomum micranthum f. kanehirae]